MLMFLILFACVFISNCIFSRSPWECSAFKPKWRDMTSPKRNFLRDIPRIFLKILYNKLKSKARGVLFKKQHKVKLLSTVGVAEQHSVGCSATNYRLLRFSAREHCILRSTRLSTFSSRRDLLFNEICFLFIKSTRSAIFFFSWKRC